MRITTKLVIDLNTGAVLEHDSYEYEGMVVLCKGDDTAKQAEQQQAAFNSQLMQIFSQQFSKQSQILDFLKGKLTPMINDPTGYAPDALAAARTSATDTIAQQYQNADKALQAKQFALGGRDLPSGVNDQLTGSLLAGQASDTAKAQDEITLQNENLKQNNFWNAMGVLSGNVTNSINPLGYANTATEGGNTVANLSQAYKSSQSSQLLGALGGIASGVGSAFSGVGTKALGCWIAEAMYGVHAVETARIRLWLNFEFTKSLHGRIVMSLYRMFGRQVASLVRTNTAIRHAMKPLFDAALIRANEWRESLICQPILAR